MKYSDEQLKDGAQHETQSVNVDADSVTMPKIVPAPVQKVTAPPPTPTDEGSFSDELVSSIFKTIFIALSLLAILTCIIAVALPLTSMRVFNNIGFSERAVDFGERYISRELRSYRSDGGRTADYTDAKGDMPVLTMTPELSNDDFIEALYVCNRLSDKLMTESLRSNDTVRARYYAERLEKYTRMYLSLNGLAEISIKNDAKNIASMPSPALQPVVYSYEHDMRVSNFRARAVLGKTNAMTYNNRTFGMGIMSTPSSRSESLSIDIDSTEAGYVQWIDDYIDYIDQLGAYLDVEFVKLGVETDLGKRVTVVDNGKELTNVPVLSETFVRSQYMNKILTGEEFSLFITPLSQATETSNGFTLLFNQLSKFTRYAQLAVDIVPNEDNGELHRLYWLRVLSSVSQKLWYMEMILYYNRGNLGLNSDAVGQMYGTCQKYTMVKYEDPKMPGVTSYQISEVYSKKLTQYVAQYQSKEK
ncbi:MAG: hypothetical protein K2O04_07705 [Clostridiales bacterium]|nr:hypothetical protein [Clostridiales bacterium]